MVGTNVPFWLTLFQWKRYGSDNRFGHFSQKSTPTGAKAGVTVAAAGRLRLAVLLTHPSMHNTRGDNEVEKTRPLLTEKGTFRTCIRIDDASQK